MTAQDARTRIAVNGYGVIGKRVADSDMAGVLLGLLASFGAGWYVALIFGPLFNVFSARRAK